jgi:hypothetical protein
MPENIEHMESFDRWTELLWQSRQALSTLSPDILEDLAVRAECMSAATVTADLIRDRVAGPQGRGRDEMVKEKKLLRDLLHASHRNLKVLSRTDEASPDQENSIGTRPRWVR